MHKIWIFALCIFTVSSILAQDDDTDYHYHIPQSSTLSIGIGVPSTTQVAAKFIGLVNQEAKASPQFTLRYEYAVNDRIGLGVYTGYYTGKTESIALPQIQLDSILNDPGSIIDNLLGGSNSASTTYQINVLTLGAHLTYHIYKLDKLDTYTILKGGYNIVSVKEDGIKNNSFVGAQVPHFEYFAGAGARYYFNRNIALYGEIGNSILSPIHVNLGGTWRF